MAENEVRVLEEKEPADVKVLHPGRRIVLPGPEMDVWHRMSGCCVYKIPKGHAPCPGMAPLQQDGCGRAESHPDHKCEYVKCPILSGTIK